jgi:tripartite-type tricarboxylate transporter receptor subunit TctC
MPAARNVLDRLWRFAQSSLSIAVVAIASMPASTLAQPFPSKPIRIIVPSGPGVGPDIVSRTFGPKLAEGLGQSVVIENRPGGATTIAASAVANSPPDGYTLYLTITATLSVLPHMSNNLGFDPAGAFAPVVMVSTMPFVLFVNANVPATNVRELVELAKAKPGQLNFAGASGTLPHVAGFMFMAATGTDLTFIPYKSVAAAIPDMLSGSVQVIIEAFASFRPHLQSGKVRALVTANSARYSQLPDVPSANEAGIPSFQVNSYFGLLAPKRTPPEVIQRLNAEMQKVLAAKEIREMLQRVGMEPAGGTPERFAEYIGTDARLWGPAVKASGAKLE